MKNHIVTFIIILASTLNIQSQEDNNLVLNPSFESVDGKLKKLTQINVANDWDSPTALKADLFSTSISGDISVPRNIYGKEFPKDGENYSGILVYSYNNKKPRTYIQSQLVKPLASGLDYCIKIHVSLADLSKYAIDKIGIHFSDEQLSLDKKGDIIFNNKADFSSIVNNEKSKIYKSRYKWETICGTYQADGKEKYITIGNFYNNKDIKYEKLTKIDTFPGTQLPEAYYYIDEIEVTLSENPESCSCDENQKKKRESLVYNLDVLTDENASTETKLKNNTIYFDVESFNLDPVFDDNLSKVVQILVADSTLKLQMNGHTDNLEKEAIKDDPENKKLIYLGSYRSKSVKDFLIKNGISASRLSTEDLKANQPVSRGTSSFSYAKNRRVEFVILK